MIEKYIVLDRQRTIARLNQKLFIDGIESEYRAIEMTAKIILCIPTFPSLKNFAVAKTTIDYTTMVQLERK